MRPARFVAGFVIAAVPFATPAGTAAAKAYPWLLGRTSDDTLAARIRTPPGYERIPGAEAAFASWLRGLPLHEPGTAVRLFDGREKSYQGGAFAVVDIDTGSRDLQQCADVVIRLRAEYLLQAGCADRISFDFTSGDHARWADWRAGQRPVVSGNSVTWVQKKAPDASYAAFREYLDSVFTYAGSYSLARELKKVADSSEVLPGDVFIQGGFPGHAVLVADVAANPEGRRVFVLVQGYTPAQDVHVLGNPADGDSPWYPALEEGTLRTPEWIFSYADLRRFPEPDCAPR